MLLFESSNDRSMVEFDCILGEGGKHRRGKRALGGTYYWSGQVLWEEDRGLKFRLESANDGHSTSHVLVEE